MNGWLIITMALLSAHPAVAAFSKPKTVWVWSEFSTEAEIEPAIVTLKSNKVGVIRSVQPLGPSFEADLKIISKLQQNGISVKPWILLPEGDGYWMSSFNPEKSIDGVDAWLKGSHAAGIYLNDIVLDFESPVDRIRKFSQAMGKLKISQGRKALLEGHDHAQYVQAQKLYQAAFDRWKIENPGLKIHIVTSPLIVLDSKNDWMEEFFGLPIRHLKFDTLSFMIYRSEFVKYFKNAKQSFTGYFTDKALQKMQTRYRMDRSALSIDLGVFGSFTFPEKTDGIPFEDLPLEVNSAFDRDVSEVHLYSLDNLMRDGKLSYLNSLTENLEQGLSLQRGRNGFRWGLLRLMRFFIVPRGRP